MTICGTEYTLIAEEDAAYMEKVGAMVDKEMRELMDTAHMSRDNAAVLAAVKMCIRDRLGGARPQHVPEHGRLQLLRGHGGELHLRVGQKLRPRRGGIQL